MHWFYGQRVRPHALTVKVVDNLLLAVSILGKELNTSVALRAYPLATVCPLLYYRVSQHLMQFRRSQFLGTHRGHRLVEERLCPHHQFTQCLGITLSHIFYGQVNYLLVVLTESLLLPLLHLVGGKRETTVQVTQDLDGVLLRA